MKVAVLITGNIRTWNRSNLHNFIDIDVDYYISTTNLKYNYHPFISNKYGYNNVNNVLISDDDIKEIFNFTENISIYNDTPIDKSNFNELMCDIDSCYYQFNRIKESLKYINNYDVIIKTRFDLKYKGKLSEYVNIKDNEIITSTGNGNPNDTIIISKLSNFKNIINYMIDEFTDKKSSTSHEMPPHGLLNSALNNFDIKNNIQNLASIIRL